jgi:hypothetical protein
VLLNSVKDGDEGEQEAVVGLGLDGGVEQVLAAVSGHGPVAVLARSVDTLERLLVEEDLELVLVSDLGENIHGQQVVVNSKGSLLEDRGALELLRSDLVVAGLDGDTKTEELELSLGHGGHNLGRNTSKVVIVHLLVLGREVTDQGAASVLQVRAERVEGAIDQEVLLLCSEGGVDMADLGLGANRDGVDEVQELRGSLGDGRGGAKKDSLLVKSIAVVRDEDRGDVQYRGAMGSLLDEHG